MLLRILVEARGAQHGIEIGAANGFGAINMGIAFERTGGRLFSFEADPARVRETRENLAKVRLDAIVTVVEGDALQTLPEHQGGIDFVFIDAVKTDYREYLRIIEPKLSPGAVVIADNVIRHAEAMTDYLEYVQTSSDYDTVIIQASSEKGDGMAVSYKIR